MKRTLDDQIAAFVRYAAGGSSERAATNLKDAVARLRDEGVPEADIADDAEVAGMLARLRASVSVPS